MKGQNALILHEQYQYFEFENAHAEFLAVRQAIKNLIWTFRRRIRINLSKFIVRILKFKRMKDWMRIQKKDLLLKEELWIHFSEFASLLFKIHQKLTKRQLDLH